MKLIKRVIFLLTFLGIFVFVYRQCDQKGFRRLVESFKMAVLLTSVVLGLIPISAEASGNNGKIINNPTRIEKLVSQSSYNHETDEYEELEFFEGNGQIQLTKGADAFPNSIRLKTGSGTVLTVRKHQNQTSEALKSALKVLSYKKNAPRKINEKFESKAVKKLVKKALNNQDVKKEYDRIKKRLGEGIHPIDINKKSVAVGDNKVLIKAYLLEVFKDRVDVLGIGARGNNRNIQTLQDLMNEMYDLNLQY